jgi:hypothetical protein
MAINNYTLDGVKLLDPQLRWFPDKSTGVRVHPARRAGRIYYPGVDGEFSVRGASYEPGGVTINLHVRGKTHKEFMENKEFIDGLVGQRHKLLPLEHSYNGTTIDRVADVEIVATIEPSLIHNKPLSALFTIPCVVPGAFWRSPDTITTPIYNAVATDTTHTLPNMGNAPINDALIRVKGAFSAIWILDPVSRSKVFVNASVAANEYVIIDPKNWSAIKTTSTSWTATGSNFSQFVESNNGFGEMWSLEPDVSSGAMRYRIITNATNPVGPTVEIRARKSYL